MTPPAREQQRELYVPLTSSCVLESHHQPPLQPTHLTALRALKPYPAPTAVLRNATQANVEITSRYDGVVRKVLWDVGDMVQVGTTVESHGREAWDDQGDIQYEVFLTQTQLL